MSVRSRWKTWREAHPSRLTRLLREFEQSGDEWVYRAPLAIPCWKTEVRFRWNEESQAFQMLGSITPIHIVYFDGRHDRCSSCTLEMYMHHAF